MAWSGAEQTEVLIQSGKGIPVQPQLGDDVLRQVGLDTLVPPPDTQEAWRAGTRSVAAS